MSAYHLSLLLLVLALSGQAIAAGLSIECYLRQTLTPAQSRSWLAMSLGTLLLALHHGHTLELALRTGLYDLRQAALAGLVGLFFALGVYGFRRQQA